MRHENNLLRDNTVINFIDSSAIMPAGWIAKSAIWFLAFCRCLEPREAAALLAGSQAEPDSFVTSHPVDAHCSLEFCRMPLTASLRHFLSEAGKMSSQAMTSRSVSCGVGTSADADAGCFSNLAYRKRVKARS